MDILPEEEKIIVPLCDGFRLVASRGGNPEHPEIYIDLIHPGPWPKWQQIACVGLDEKSMPVRVLVWSDPNSEDYTDAFKITPHDYKED